MFHYSDSQSLAREAAVRPRRSPAAAPLWAGSAAAPVPGWFGWLERVGALVALVLLSPALVTVAAVIFLLSGRPPLIAHARVGQYGRHIWMLKFRTMWPKWTRRPKTRRPILIERIEGAPVPQSKMVVDSRVTSGFAAFCRRHSIDELPQLWHVLTGEMSLVGPRPVTIQEFERWYSRDAAEILQWKPGLTGLWQVKGRSSLSYMNRRRLDQFLVAHWSIALYLNVLLSTIPCVITGDNAN